MVECLDSLFTFSVFTEYSLLSLLSLFTFSLFHFARDSPKQIKLGSEVMIKDYKSDF